MRNTYKNFEILNSGIYHDTQHVLTVSKLASSMAKNAGFCRKLCRFLAQVALIHDADERKDPKSGERNPLQHPRLNNTLDWMTRNEDYLCRHFSWTRSNFLMAQAVVARTAFPYDNTPRDFGSEFKGLSPVEVSHALLRQLPAEDRANAVRMGIILHYADQIANYCGPWRRLQHTLNGLVEELKASGIELTVSDLDPVSVLRSAGSELSHDRGTALKFGLGKECLYDQAALLSFLPKNIRKRLDANINELVRKAAA